MSVKERLKSYIKHIGISIIDFEKSINVSNGYVNSISKGIGNDKTALIIENYPNLNLDWLLTGKGDMLKTDIDEPDETMKASKSASKPHYEIANYKPRPFIDAFYGALGVPNGFTLAVRADECEQISIPFISDYDFSIKGRGDSMINRKNPDRSICDGDLIACRIWTSRSYIQWGQVYALATSQGVVIKQIQESEKEGYIKCVSFNDEDGYTPYEIPVEEIHDWALVVSVTHTAKW